MPRLPERLVIFLASLMFAAPVAAHNPDWASIDAMVAQYEREDAPGISVAISIDGEPVYERWAGQADIENGVPIDADSRFQIASVSKQFTALAIMLLVDEGRLSLDQDIRTVIPELAQRQVPIEIRHLLNHTGGLREVNTLLELTGATNSSPVDHQQSLDLIRRQQGSNFPAGTQQEYSNTGYQLLAEIVTRVSGMSFADFIRERIFRPAGMTHSFVRTDPFAIVDRLAESYRPTGSGFANARSLAATYGSTGIVSTPSDLLRWAQALESERIASARVVRMMEARAYLPDGRRAIGTNGQEYRNYRGVDTWSHGGSEGGFRSFLLRIPGEKVAIAVTGNRADFKKAAFAFEVADIVLADTLEAKPDDRFTPEKGSALDRYTGDYELYAGVIFSVRRKGDDLTFATFGKQEASPVEQVGRGVFLLNPDAQLRMEFHDFADGEAREMRWQISQDGYLIAPRVEMDGLPEASHRTEAIVGKFYSEELQQVATLFDKGGELWLRVGSASAIPLEQYQADVFRPLSGGSVQRVRLIRDAAGGVREVLLSAPLARDISFSRIEIAGERR